MSLVLRFTNQTPCWTPSIVSPLTTSFPPKDLGMLATCTARQSVETPAICSDVINVPSINSHVTSGRGSPVTRHRMLTESPSCDVTVVGHLGKNIYCDVTVVRSYRFALSVMCIMYNVIAELSKLSNYIISINMLTNYSEMKCLPSFSNTLIPDIC